MSKGKLYLIPSLLGGDSTETIPEYVKNLVKTIDVFIVENLRDARRYLVKIGIKSEGKKIDDLTFHHLDKHDKSLEIDHFLAAAEQGQNIGLLSDAGCPAVADPGGRIVYLAHQKGIEVVPLVGPSSILLALMASGLNGQSFAFIGYLPIKPDAREKRIRLLEKFVHLYRQTQILIEVPYRNNVLLKALLKSGNDKTKLCIAANLSLDNEYICTKSIYEWRNTKNLPDLHKQPCIFLLGC
jgi:16S rRNA (cytidine1402-2'-O)-methyltransferase